MLQVRLATAAIEPGRLLARFPLSSRHRDDDQREDGEEAAGEEDATVPEGSF